MNQTIKKKAQAQDGFTLHEITFVILISGIMTLMLVQGMKVLTKKFDNEKLELAIENAQSVLTNVTSQTFRYPCPAPNVPEGNPLFGIEGPRNPATGMCAAGAGITVTGGANPVFIGLFPRQIIMLDGTLIAAKELIIPNAVIKSRQLLNGELLDPWGNDLTYAVSGAQTQQFFDLNAGAISLLDSSGTATRGIVNDADYIVLSHGENGCAPLVAALAFNCADAAAVAENPGLAALVCPAPGAGINMELENCDNDSTFATGPRNNLIAGRARFDDILGTFVFRGRQTWEDVRVIDGAGNTTERQSVRLSPNITSIGINTAAPQWPLEVNGDTIVEGETAARLICSRTVDASGNTDSDINNQTCVDPRSLTRNVSCGPGEYMREFNIIPDANNPENRVFSITCQDIGDDLSGFVINAGGTISGNGNCPIRGILSDGRIVCL